MVTVYKGTGEKRSRKLQACEIGEIELKLHWKGVNQGGKKLRMGALRFEVKRLSKNMEGRGRKKVGPAPLSLPRE